MKRRLSLFGMSAAMMLGCVGCAIESKPDAYFVVDIYADYDGMEADAAAGNYDTGKSTKIGYCYVAKEQKDASGVDFGKFNIGGVRTYNYQKAGKTETYDYRTAFRESPHWYQKYVFNSFQGFYAAGKPIDLDKITANCALFSTFDLVNDNFPISVRDPYGDIAKVKESEEEPAVNASEIVPYGTKIVDIPSIKTALLNYPKSHDPEADPDDPTTYRDPYYCTYENDGWYLYLYDKDGKLIEGDLDANKKPITRRIPSSTPEATLAAIEDMTVEGKMIFEPGFAEDFKEYEVTISYQKRTLNHFDTETGDAYFDYEPFVPPKNTSGNDLPTVLSVRYGRGITYEDPTPEKGFGRFDLADYRLTLDGKDGGIDRYDIDDPLLPTPLKETYYDGEGNPHFRGVMVKRQDICYTCSITLVYEEFINYTVRFHDDPSNPAAFTAVTVGKNEAAKGPSKLKSDAPAGKTFVTGNWTKVENSLEIADLSNIVEDMDVFPVYVDTKITNGMTHFEYDFDLYYGGYLLTKVPDGTTTIAAEDFGANFPTIFPFKGIRSFGDEASIDLLNVTLPSTVSVVEQGVFTKLINIVNLDLSQAKITTLPAMSFKNLAHLEYVHLPATLTSVGADQFRHCTILLTEPGVGVKRVEIDLTADEVTALINAKQFDANWHSNAYVTYKAA